MPLRVVRLFNSSEQKALTEMSFSPQPLAQFYVNGEVCPRTDASDEDRACAHRITALLTSLSTTLSLPDLEQILVDGVAVARRRATDETALILQSAASSATASLGAGVSTAVTSLEQAAGKMQSEVGTTVHTAVSAALDLSTPNSPLSAIAGSVTAASKGVSDDVFRSQGQVMEAITKLRTDVLTHRAETEARAEERSKSSAKGRDFEDYLEEVLGEFAVRENIILVSTGTTEGALKACKKGDFLFTNSAGDVLFLVEAKDNASRETEAKIHSYLDEACRNRNTKLALWAVNGSSQNRGSTFTRLTDQRWVVSAAEDDKEVFFLVLHIMVTMARVTASGGGGVETGKLETAKQCVQSAITSMDALRMMRMRLSDMDKAVLGVRELVASMESDVVVPLREAMVALNTSSKADDVAV